MKVDLSQAEPKILVSSNLALLAGGTYTSPVFDVRGYTSIAGFAYSDQGSAANGFVIQQAADTADFNTGYLTQSVDTVLGGDAITNSFIVTIVAPFARIVYTNGAVAQNTFRLFMMARLIGA